MRDTVNNIQAVEPDLNASKAQETVDGLERDMAIARQRFPVLSDPSATFEQLCVAFMNRDASPENLGPAMFALLSDDVLSRAADGVADWSGNGVGTESANRFVGVLYQAGGPSAMDWYERTEEQKMSELPPEGLATKVVTDGAGTVRRYKSGGLLHCDSGPAVEYSSGAWEYYKDGSIHRYDGPACRDHSGNLSWFAGGWRLGKPWLLEAAHQAFAAHNEPWTTDVMRTLGREKSGRDVPSQKNVIEMTPQLLAEMCARKKSGVELMRTLVAKLMQSDALDGRHFGLKLSSYIPKVSQALASQPSVRQ